jgi:hypothetical protein
LRAAGNAAAVNLFIALLQPETVSAGLGLKKFTIKSNGEPILQGDQIGRKFAHWVIVYFGQFF